MLRILQNDKDNINVDNYKDIHDKISSNEYQNICNKEEIIENGIKKKLWPILLKYFDNMDYEGAKWFVGKSYKELNTVGKILLFRSILIRENEIIGKYNL